MRLRPRIGIPCLLLMLGCYAPAGRPSANRAEQASGPTPTRITVEELDTAPQLNAREAIERFRPRWLRIRGVNSLEQSQLALAGIRIYVNGTRRGNIEELEQLRVTDIQEMRWLSGGEATVRFGSDHVEGAILVTLKG